jgi:N-methylhydantoinase A
VQPVLDRYLTRLRTELSAKGFDRDLLVMQGNGGTISSQLIARAAVNTVMSGPASGVMAAAYTGRVSGHPDLITYDMGGTSTDVGLIEDAVPQVSGELELEYAMPIHVPMVDVHTIGAGGGSIASVDSAGMLRVGPESAGARPGPICYGRGGTEPTITDASLVLGRLNPDRLLGVDHPVTLDHVRALIEEKVGRRLGLDAEAAAAAILRVANDRMAGAIRLVSLSRGHDPRDFALFAFGGAGPLHATALARELAIPTVLVPARPGITNALGCVVADLRHDYVRTVNKPLSALDDATVARIYAEQTAEGQSTIAGEGVPVRELRYVHTADMQFAGQSHILSVAIERADISIADLHKAFAAAYWKRFGIELAEIPPVLVNLHTGVIGVRPEIDLGALASGERAPTLKDALSGTRRVWFSDGWHDTPVYARDRLPKDAEFQGPAILEQLDCTTVVDPGDTVRQDELGNLLIAIG